MSQTKVKSRMYDSKQEEPAALPPEVRGLVLRRDGALWTVSPCNCENADLTEKKKIIIRTQTLRKDAIRDKERSTQWKAVCGKSARTV